MSKALQILTAVGFIMGLATTGLAMDKEAQSNPGSANTPDNIQRSTPSGEASLPGGSGPGSRSDELTDMEEVDPKNPNLAKKQGSAAEAAKKLQQESQGISSQSSSQKSH